MSDYVSDRQPQALWQEDEQQRHVQGGSESMAEGLPETSEALQSTLKELRVVHGQRPAKH